jgi:hypothetical protein
MLVLGDDVLEGLRGARVGAGARWNCHRAGSGTRALVRHAVGTSLFSNLGTVPAHGRFEREGTIDHAGDA